MPLAVTFGPETFKAGLDLSTEQFWRRITAPDSPFPTTAASAPGDFKSAYDTCFDRGADAIVSVHVAGTLSGTIKSAEIAAGMFPDREIHVVDSTTASMGVGLLALLARELAGHNVAARDIARTLTERRTDVDLFVAVDTLDYLKRGGRIGGAQAAIGTLLSVKPIITVRNGAVETADRVRTRQKARDRVLELLTGTPIERVALLHTTMADVERFAHEFAERSGIDRSEIPVVTVGPAVGAHIGPGCVGGVVIRHR